MSTPVDFSLFLDGDDKQRRQGALQLYDSLRSQGFVRLQNHGITDEDVATIFRHSRSFFALPNEKKETILHSAGPKPQRGWSRVGAEDTSSLYRKGFLGQGMTDKLSECREHFDMASVRDQEFPNRYPDEKILPEFRTFANQTFTSMETLCHHILQALEVAMDLPSGFFTDRCTTLNSASELRMTRYPALAAASLDTGKMSRIWPHFDLGVITLLFQDSVGGLEFQDREAHAGTEAFVPVPSDRQSDLIVNISETLQRWTNDHLRAGLHRVVAPPGQDDKRLLQERFSMAYFCKADKDVNVGALAPFTKNGTKYDDMTALEYHQQRLVSAYN